MRHLTDPNDFTGPLKTLAKAVRRLEDGTFHGVVFASDEARELCEERRVMGFELEGTGTDGAVKADDVRKARPRKGD